MKKIKKVLGLLLATSMLGVTACSGPEEVAKQDNKEVVTEESSKVDDKGEKEKKTEKKKEEVVEQKPVIIKYGSHAAHEEDPNYKDPITNEYRMGEDERIIRLQALETIKEELNVELEFVQYAGDVTEVLLQSVMAGDPVCDIARIYANGQGTLLAQNVLQPVDDYVELLGDNPPPKIYGHQYFVQIDGNNIHPLAPLMFNINYIEQVDALKENGKTVYPTDLYLAGEWTWSVFEDYLEKIDTHFTNIPSPGRPEQRIEAYWTDYRDVAQQAMHSAGTSVYGPNGLEIATDRTKESIGFMTDLYDKGIMKSPPREGSSKPDSGPGKTGFINGEAVFCNLEDWRTGEATTVFAERGDSLGFVPFPRPDDMAFDDPNYRQVRIGGESYAIVRGIEEEKIPLALKSFKLYNEEVKRLKEEAGMSTQTATLSFDQFHPEIGQDMMDIYKESIGRTYVNEISNVLGIHVQFNDIVGRSLYGMEGTPKFDVAIESEKIAIEDRITEVETMLNSGEFVDNIGPQLQQVEGENLVFPVGTNPEEIEWNKKISGTDNVDGTIEINKDVIDVSMTDFNKIGTYTPGVKVQIQDAAGNGAGGEYPVIIYNPENTTQPTITLKSAIRTFAKEEDSSTINWVEELVESALDADSIDVKGMVKVDLAELDTTTSGTYTIKVSVTDYANNTAEVEVEVVVE